MDAEPWYSARCIFRHRASGTRPTCYEERVVLLRASGFDDAMRRAEAEAREYAGSLENTEYVGCLDAYHLYIESVGDGTEVFSLIRESELRPQEYVSRFFQTGSERALTVKAEELA